MNLDHDSKLFFAEPMEDIVVIHFKKNLLGQLAELPGKEDFLQYLESVSREPRVKVVLLLGCPEKVAHQEAVAFFRSLTGPGANEYRTARVFNAVNQIVLSLRAMPQFVIHGDCGEIQAPFFNISLACDYRIMGDRAVLKFTSPELGLIPKGGGIYFLLEHLGRSKTWEILLSPEGIGAQKALEMGLVDRVVPSAFLEEESIAHARRLGKMPLHLLAGAKSLINLPPMELSAFLERENQVLTENIMSERFQVRLEREP
ncbi:MAG: enoyl-CoA hydratase/isomerase family protein [Proteobacteria bacterium]|nr:enoyl-CoA hydratase/isomerase family protein [Pseudomonadota bacterium]